MAEEIQYIIDQIQKEGVEKASEKGKKIIESAKEEAKKIISDAEKIYNEKCEIAKNEAMALEEKSLNSIKQASRDLLILLGQSCEKLVLKSLNTSVKKEIDASFLKDLILKVVSNTNNDLNLSLNSSDILILKDFIISTFENSSNEVSLVENNEILNGFTVGIKDENVYLDYTNEAISEALSSFLRPELSKIINEIVKEDMTKS